MIICMNGHVRIEGTGGEIICDAAAILHEIREATARDFSEKTSNEVIALIGRLATADEEQLKSGDMSLIDGLFE